MEGHDSEALARRDEERSRADAREGLELLELVDESIFLRDLDGRIRYWNQACERLYGWSRAQALGRPAHELLGCRHTHPVGEPQQLALSQGRWGGEIVRRTADGRELLIEAR